MKIGVLGGTFDPPHLGHLRLAEAVRLKLGLDEVLFVPAGVPYLKEGDRAITPAEHRVAMVRLAIKDYPHFRLSLTEVERPGPSYTVDTIAELRKDLKEGDELFFILGWDNLLALPGWREPPRLVKLCKLVAMPRAGYPVPDLKALDKVIPGIALRTTVLFSPVINISATVIRERVARGLSVSQLVPEAVAEYIKKHQLYQKID
ncbi:MAG: nicotinate-nucleotide adenylyltransferase [Chloroflexota bacterium]